MVSVLRVLGVGHSTSAAKNGYNQNSVKIMQLLTWYTGWPGWLGPLVVILALQGEGVQQKICVQPRTKPSFQNLEKV